MLTGELRRWSAIHVVLAVWCCALVVTGAVSTVTRHDSAAARLVAATTSPVAAAAPAGHPARPALLPGGRTKVFRGRFLVAYYGTAGTGSLGVLGDAPPDRIWPRLVRAGRPFARHGLKLQPVFELIVSVATSGAGPDGDYSGDIPRSAVRRYIRAAHRHGALLVLDLQPGRSDFLRIAKRWAWALEDPWVGLALDPEWRMGPHEVPAHVIGHVRAAEVNRVSAWLEHLTVAHHLPQKVFMLHQFRVDMIRDIQRIRPRPHLAMVQHVDGFGTPGQKLATYHAVVRPGKFREGFKLFYRQDVHRMSPARVLGIRPRVRFVSFQ